MLARGGEQKAMYDMWCHGHVARTTLYYIGARKKHSKEKSPYTIDMLNTDICKDMRSLKQMLNDFGGLKMFVPSPLLIKLNKIVLDAK